MKKTVKKNIYLWFIELEKAFNRINYKTGIMEHFRGEHKRRDYRM